MLAWTTNPMTTICLKKQECNLDNKKITACLNRASDDATSQEILEAKKSY